MKKKLICELCYRVKSVRANKCSYTQENSRLQFACTEFVQSTCIRSKTYLTRLIKTYKILNLGEKNLK